uniref:basic salivary proline-rich protein 3-like n=1 Tax=Panthera onca TaxID=9690 RepID=UPI002953402C|nr:basic salivary proline-rich protein 3-like [Panthera onca]
MAWLCPGGRGKGCVPSELTYGRAAFQEPGSDLGVRARAPLENPQGSEQSPHPPGTPRGACLSPHLPATPLSCLLWIPPDFPFLIPARESPPRRQPDPWRKAGCPERGPAPHSSHGEGPGHTWPPVRWVLGSLTEPPLPGHPPGLLPSGEKDRMRPQDLCLLPRGSTHDRGRARAGERQRERETRNPKEAPGSELSAQSPTRGSNSQTVRSGPEPKSDASPTEPPRRPDFSWGGLGAFSDQQPSSTWDTCAPEEGLDVASGRAARCGSLALAPAPRSHLQLRQRARSTSQAYVETLQTAETAQDAAQHSRAPPPAPRPLPPHLSRAGTCPYASAPSGWPPPGRPDPAHRRPGPGHPSSPL